MVQVDLSGGYYDAGDNVKFGFPMAFSTAILAWSVLEFGRWMPKELDHAREAVRWGTDYLLKACSALPEALYVQVCYIKSSFLHQTEITSCHTDPFQFTWTKAFHKFRLFSPFNQYHYLYHFLSCNLDLISFHDTKCCQQELRRWYSHCIYKILSCHCMHVLLWFTVQSLCLDDW